MSRFIVQGTISSVKYLPDSCVVFLDEYKAGYKKANGQIVDDTVLTWKIIFKAYFKTYIAKYFDRGDVVEIVAEMYPYEMEQGKLINGYSAKGKEIEFYSTPRPMAKKEKKMIKESQLHSSGTPDLEGYNTPDF